jgi:hypothetical protein
MLNYDLINQDFAYKGTTPLRRTEDNDWQTASGQIYDPYDQYLQSLNQAGSMGIAADDMQRWTDTAQKMGMSLEQYLGYAMPAGWTTSTDKYGSTIYNSNDGTVNYGGFPQANWADGTENGWMLPLMVATAGAADMGMFGNLFGSGATGTAGSTATGTGSWMDSITKFLTPSPTSLGTSAITQLMSGEDMSLIEDLLGDYDIPSIDDYSQYGRGLDFDQIIKDYGLNEGGLQSFSPSWWDKLIPSSNTLLKTLFGSNKDGTEKSLMDFLGGMGGTNGLLGSAVSSAPMLAAINYARDQAPIDTSRMTSLYNSFNPQANAGLYDVNTGLGREDLTSSIQRRGISGSSFGDQSLTNFNTARDVGRNQLINQGVQTQAGLAGGIMDADFKSRQLKNDLYGRALLALSGGLAPRQAGGLLGGGG